MREITTQDVFAFVRMTKRAGITAELKKLILSKDSIKDLTAESFGYDLIFTILESASEPEAEKEVYNFLSGPFEMEPDEIKKLKPMTLFEMIKQMATVEEWKAFFTSVAKLMKPDLQT